MAGGGVELDLKKFYKLGEILGEDGRTYLIMVEKKLPDKREKEIIDDFALGKLKIEGHVYIPEKEETIV